MSNTLISLLLAGSVPCGGDAFEGNLFEKQQLDDERRKRQAEAEAAAEAEAKIAITFDEIKSNIRKQVEKVRAIGTQIETDGRDKKLRQAAAELVSKAFDVIDDRYDECVNALSPKDKYKQSLKEGAELVTMLRTAVESLDNKVRRANKENSNFGRFKNWINDIVNDD